MFKLKSISSFFQKKKKQSGVILMIFHIFRSKPPMRRKGVMNGLCKLASALLVMIISGIAVFMVKEVGRTTQNEEMVIYHPWGR